MADGLTLRDLDQIKKDAHKTVTRQFRDAAEDHGWMPTETPDSPSAVETATTEDDLEHVTGDPSNEPSIKELRDKAKELNLSAGGSKQDIVTRIDEHLASQEGDNE